MRRLLLYLGVVALLILGGVTVAMANFDKVPEKPEIIVNEPPDENPRSRRK